jgi:Subtilase family
VRADQEVEARALLDLPRSDGESSPAGPSYVQLMYEGEVSSAVRDLKAAGIEAQPDHVFFADAHANPVYGNPVYGNPVYGNPVYGNPVYGNPVYGNPVYGNPVYGNPVYGNPVYGNPVYGNPAGGSGGCSCGGGCAGGPHCCDSDPCTCPEPTVTASGVYPHPIYARAVYGQAGLRYEKTGQRPTTAIPLFSELDELPANQPKWDEEHIRVAILDTGWPVQPVGAPPGWTANAKVSGGDPPVDVPDSDKNGRLEPVAGHGMFIAGIVAQYAPEVSVTVYRVLNGEGDGSESDIANKIEMLAANGCPPHVISLSFGTYAPEEPIALRAAIRHATARGIIVVASAGNDATSRKSYPAAYENVVSVAALGPSGAAPFTNWGAWVRACAPGVDVASAFWGFDGAEGRDGCCQYDTFEMWALWSGTSFAAPIVAAALARELSRYGAPAPADMLKRARRVIESMIDHPRLHRIPCLGTVINPPPTLQKL